MLRVRFRANLDDPRPIKFPITHPYWVSGTGDDFAIVVAYAETEEEIYKLWPEASDLDSQIVDCYHFTSRFQRPEWWRPTGFPIRDDNPPPTPSKGITMSDINILITGGTSLERGLVSNAVADGLEEVGFTDVKLVNAMDEEVRREDTVTMLDRVKSLRPELFEKSIQIRSRPAAGEVDELTTGGLMTDDGEEITDDEGVAMEVAEAMAQANDD